MSTVISRRSFLKCTGASAAVLGAASLLGGCKSNGNDTVVEVKVGDTVRNWNGLGVQLTSVFHLTQDPVQPAGYEYLGVRVTTVNRSKTESYAIGAQGIDAINEAYPVPPLENRGRKLSGHGRRYPGLYRRLRWPARSLLRQYLAVQRQFPELFRCGEPAPAGQRLHRADAHGAQGLEAAEGHLCAHLPGGKSLTFVMNASDVIRS